MGIKVKSSPWTTNKTLSYCISFVTWTQMTTQQSQKCNCVITHFCANAQCFHQSTDTVNAASYREAFSRGAGCVLIYGHFSLCALVHYLPMFQQHHHFPQGYLAVPRTQPGIWLAGNMTEECTKDFKSSDKGEN